MPLASVNSSANPPSPLPSTIATETSAFARSRISRAALSARSYNEPLLVSAFICFANTSYFQRRNGHSTGHDIYSAFDRRSSKGLTLSSVELEIRCQYARNRGQNPNWDAGRVIFL